ncbi:hypothetical protein A2704_01380 [Candidatus Kaiserbacteria bacterium RIFCSPHIGHO2_01_FULL_54_36b]|uniref:Uncharacterized protein n=1 Tax=Candidatus Kaiserbacteria bacterium RIFCSPHIGHO2_01_FULL_54_36b TaxID=1798483 RepID=A0A1F6CLZ2_9BACT|nr:MAG: hypothetical protein A2704_01380 [Candidatus Kaiserbacteria bacterium RIFCSPHIGHO2_01_FULL_54_36b]
MRESLAHAMCQRRQSQRRNPRRGKPGKQLVNRKPRAVGSETPTDLTGAEAAAGATDEDMNMRILFIGHGRARDALTALAADIRRNHGSHLVSCYFDRDLDMVNAQRGLPDCDFLFLGLSIESRDNSSAAYAIEKDVLERATSSRLRIPCGIVCDQQGLVSAPYLMELGSHIRLVVAHEHNHECRVAELCEHALPVYIPDIATGAHKLLRAVDEILHPPRRVRA